MITLVKLWSGGSCREIWKVKEGTLQFLTNGITFIELKAEKKITLSNACQVVIEENKNDVPLLGA